MTDAGWHPDPHGRADRRYHDGTGWTAHVADADGATSRDPHGAGAEPQAPPAPPLIGPPPPRSSPTPPAAAPDPGHTQPTSPADLPPPPSDPADALRWAEPTADVAADRPAATPADVPAEASAPRADRTQQLSAADLAAATSSSQATPTGSPDHTVVMTPEEVAAAAALASAPPAVEARQGPHTEPISTRDLTAAAAALAAGDGAPDGGRARTRPRVIAVVGVLIGIALGGAGLLLPWTTAGGIDASYLDLRKAVDTFGASGGTTVDSFVLTGALFAVGVGGVAALARVIGRVPVRVVAAVVAVLGTAGLAVLGFAAIEVDGPVAPTADAIAPASGSPVTLPDGTPVTDPTTGTPVTVPEGGIDPGQVSDDALLEAAETAAEDRMGDAAVLGAALLVVAGLLLLVGLGLRGTPGHVVTAVGLLFVARWAIVALLDLRDGGPVGPGPYAVAASTVVLALSAAVPHRRRPPDPSPEQA